MKVIKENRIGKFTFEWETIKEASDNLMNIFGKVFIVNVEFSFEKVTYTGYSELFKPQMKGMAAMYYRISVNDKGEVFVK